MSTSPSFSTVPSETRTLTFFMPSVLPMSRKVTSPSGVKLTSSSAPGSIHALTRIRLSPSGSRQSIRTRLVIVWFRLILSGVARSCLNGSAFPSAGSAGSTATVTCAVARPPRPSSTV